MAPKSSFMLNINNTRINYDIKIGVLCSTKTKEDIHALRSFTNFWGLLLSNNNIKYKTIFLIDENDDELNLKISQDYCFYKTKKTGCLKWIDYLRSCEHNDSKWYLFVDLKSSTHIDVLRDYLDDNYSYLDPILLIDSKNTEIEDKQNYIVRQLGETLIPNKYNPFEINNNFNLVHSRKSFIFSNSAVEKIKIWNRFDQYCDLVDRYQPYDTHQTVAIISKYSKIPICETDVLSTELKPEDFSYLNENGRFHHITNIDKNNNKYEEFFKLILDSQDPNTPINPRSYYKFTAPNVWDFWGDENYYGILYLRDDGVIIGSTERYNESYWQNFEEHIVFLDKNRNVTCILYKKDQNFYEGPFFYNSSSVHKIRKIIS